MYFNWQCHSVSGKENPQRPYRCSSWNDESLISPERSFLPSVDGYSEDGTLKSTPDEQGGRGLKVKGWGVGQTS